MIAHAVECLGCPLGNCNKAHCKVAVRVGGSRKTMQSGSMIITENAQEVDAGWGRHGMDSDIGSKQRMIQNNSCLR